MLDRTSLKVSSCRVSEFLRMGSENIFVIPEYQRPYSWETEQVETLINDILDFTIKNANRRSASYFLGSVVSFIDKRKNEVIDGQQRITTLFLLLRAIYGRLDDDDPNKKQKESDTCANFKRTIGSLIFKTHEQTGKIYEKKPLLISKVITSDANEVLKSILCTGKADPKSKDRYSKNYCLIQKLLKEKFDNLGLFFKFVKNVLDNTIVLPITADSQDTALVIFQTLNDRGLPLSDSDIFKATIYQNLNKSLQQEFISDWKQLSEDAENNQEGIQKLFYYYMFYLRAIDQDSDSTTPGLRKYYTDKKAERLFDTELLGNLRQSLNLWKVVSSNTILQEEKWSNNPKILVMLDILRSYPNEFWKYPVEVFYLSHRNSKYFESKFESFLKKLTAVLVQQYLYSPSVNWVKGAILKLNTEIVLSNHPSFNGFTDVEWNEKAIVVPHPKIERMLLKLLAYSNSYQSKNLLPNSWEIEHIFPKKWEDHFFSGQYTRDQIVEKIEHIGNKIPLEKQLNIKASNGYFSKKQLAYKNSKIRVCRELASYKPKNSDWELDDIIQRDGRVCERIKKLLSRWSKEYGSLQTRKTTTRKRKITK